MVRGDRRKISDMSFHLFSSFVMAPPLCTSPSALGPLIFCLVASLQSYQVASIQVPSVEPRATLKVQLHRLPCSHCKQLHQLDSLASTGNLGARPADCSTSQTWRLCQVSFLESRPRPNKGFPRSQVRNRFGRESKSQQDPHSALGSPRVPDILVCHKDNSEAILVSTVGTVKYWTMLYISGH